MNGDVAIPSEVLEAFEIIENAIEERIKILENIDMTELREKQDKIKVLDESIENFYKMGMAHLTEELQQERDTLENEIEAQLLESALKEHNIPHIMRSYYDTAFDGLYQTQKGWGFVSAPESFKHEIKEIYSDLRKDNDLPSNTSQ